MDGYIWVRFNSIILEFSTKHNLLVIMGNSSSYQEGIPKYIASIEMRNADCLNCVVQCLSNTLPLRDYFTSSEYKAHINTSNSNKLKGELAKQFAKLVNAIWSHKYTRITNCKLIDTLPLTIRFKRDAMEYLIILLDKLHQDLNLIRGNIYTEKIESNGRPDTEIADLSWKGYLKWNKSKIVDLFHAQQKSNITCSECKQSTVSFDTYSYLSIPIPKSYIIDIFHRLNDKPMNKPFRHIIHINPHQKVRDLAKVVANLYDTKCQFVLFYKYLNCKIVREYEHKFHLCTVPNNKPIACYILKDWNKEVTNEEINKKKLSLKLVTLCHSQRIYGLFGIPLVACFLNIHTRREFHQVIYQRLHRLLGDDILQPPPKIVMLKKIKKNEEKMKENGDYDYNRPCVERLDEYDAEWDEVFEAVPYKLCLVTGMSEAIPIDDVPFQKYSGEEESIKVMIEWKESIYNEVKQIVNKVVRNSEYEKWQTERQLKDEKNLTLYHCLDGYLGISTDNLVKDEKVLHCDKCQRDTKANLNRDLWSSPEILIIHLQRFQKFGDNGYGQREKITTFVDCPITDLNLSPYVISKNQDIPPIYDLYAITCHVGEYDNGKYGSYILNQETNVWYYFDKYVWTVREENEMKLISSAYILFYQKRNSDCNLYCNT